MSELDELRVGDHISLLSGFPFSSDYFDQEEGIRLIRIRDLVGSGDETFYRGAFDPRWLVKPRDILIGMDGDFNIVRWKGDEALLNQRILKANEKTNGLIEQSFFYYWCGPVLVQIHNRTAATTVKHLSIKDIEKAKGLFPTKSEQRRIAEILSTLDEAIERTESLIAKYQQIKAGLMHDLFTRGVTPDGHLRPTRAQAPHLYNEFQFGWIPKEWEVRPFRTVLVGSLQNGYFKKPELVGSGYKLVNVSELYQPFGIDTDHPTVERVEATSTDVHKYNVDEGDLFFTRSSLVLSGIAQCNTVLNLKEPTLFECHVIRGRPDKNIVDPSFLGLYFQTSWARRELMSRAKQTTMTTISQPDIFSVPVVRPPLNEQTTIVQRITANMILLRSEEGFWAKLRQLKHGLMHDLLAGRVRVTVGESASA